MMLVPRHDFDFLDEIFDDGFFKGKERNLMKTDIREKNDKYIIDMDLPGFDKENIKLSLHKGYLNISAKVNKEEILVVGDRLYTDILVGVNAKVDTLCVLSGESSIDDVHKYEHKPTYILDSIKQLPDLLDKCH